MDWNEAVEEDRTALRRIVAVLLALADLAERAAGRSRLVYCLVVWLLRPADEVARDYVAGLTLDPRLAVPLPMADRFEETGAADAICLAISFRALAAALAAVMAATLSFGQVGAHAFCEILAQRLSGVLSVFDYVPVAVERRDSS